MLALSTLKYLASQKFKDAMTLFKHKRNSGAIYLMGYALELSLKAKIALTFKFHKGFPESPAELSLYSKELAIFNELNTGAKLAHIKQIKNHNLPLLLHFSGAYPRIATFYAWEWSKVNTWTPEDRYRQRRWTMYKTAEFVDATSTILDQIF